MEASVVTLYLNETGKKAFKTDTKVIYIDKPITDILEEDIDNVFPISLVDRYEVKESFHNLKPGDYVAVFDPDGNKHLGKVSSTFYNKQICVSFEGGDDDWRYRDRYFRLDGTEATHSKKKCYILRINDEQVKEMLSVIQNKPLIEILNLLSECGDITFTPEKLNVPEWLTTDTIMYIKNILSKAKYGNAYDDSFDDNDEF